MYLSDQKFTRAYASEFIRTQETAKYVLKHCKHPVPQVVIDKRISERVIMIYLSISVIR